MKLSEWMTVRGLKDTDVAGMIGVVRVTVSRIRRGKLRPSWRLAREITEATKGAVTANDFLPDKSRNAAE